MTYTAAQQTALRATADRYNDLVARANARARERGASLGDIRAMNDRWSRRGWREMDRVRRTTR